MQGRILTIGAATIALIAVAALIFLRPADTPAVPTVSIAALAVESPLGDEALGSADAPVTVIEYGSLTCPHCQNFSQTVFPEFKQRYIDTGKVRFLFREFPRDLVVDVAAFSLARCAPGENGYHAMIDLLFAHQSEWAFVADPASALRRIALQSGFTDDSFEACLTNQTISDGIVWSRDRASTEFGVSGTPTFFINGEMHVGELSLADLSAAVDRHTR